MWNSKCLEDSTKEKLLDIGLGNGFLNMTSKVVNKSKNRQMLLHQTRKLLQSKENIQQNIKVTSEMGENICKALTVKG